MKNFKKLTKIEIVKIVAVLFAVGFVLSNLTSVIWYILLGTLILIVGISIYSYISVKAEKTKKI